MINVTGVEQLIRNYSNSMNRLKIAIEQDAKIIAIQMEAWAKQNARWTDRTANARQTLKATVTWKNTDKLLVQLSHGMDYGVFLELAHNGKYAILNEAVNKYAPQFLNEMRSLFGK